MCEVDDLANAELNPLGINFLRTIPTVGRVIWGARTLADADRLGSELKYVPIRRLALHIEGSLYRAMEWVIFEPNDETLWVKIRRDVGTFLHDLFQRGAFQRSSPRDAYFVECDGETTTPSDRENGLVNVLIGFAPLKPAEFVTIKITHKAGGNPARDL